MVEEQKNQEEREQEAQTDIGPENNSENKKVLKNGWVFILALLVFVVLYLVIAGSRNWWPFTDNSQPVATNCTYEVHTARDPVTGIIQDYPSDCDVPEGWEILTFEDLAELGLVGGANNSQLGQSNQQNSELPRSDSLATTDNDDFIGPENGGGSKGQVQGQSNPPRTGAGVFSVILLAGAATAVFVTREKIKT